MPLAAKVYIDLALFILFQVKREELEGQIRQLQQMFQQQKEREEELVNRIGKLQDEKRMLQDRVANLQKTLAQAEQDKRELERAQIRVEKDKKALKTTLEKVHSFKQCVGDSIHSHPITETGDKHSLYLCFHFILFSTKKIPICFQFCII